jgi:pantoate--beta-alanine ligase
MKLFQIVPANKAYFGRKDYQQLLAVRRMARDLNVPIEIVACAIVREADGLAMSSRNAYLSPDDRRRASILPRALGEARKMFESGERDAARIRDRLRQMIAAEGGLQLDYLVVVDPHTLDELSRIEASAVVLLAARVGSTRLIDNEVLGAIED